MLLQPGGVTGGMMAKRRASKPHGVLYYLRMGLSVGLFAVVALVGALAVVVPAATGSTPLTVLTGSMQPAYPPGTLIIVKPLDSADIRIGDPVTYQIESGKPAVVTHRVISITSGSDGSVSFTTQGDANNAADATPVMPEQIRGKVWYALPYLGYVNSALNGEARAWLIQLIAGGLFLYIGYLVTSVVVSKIRTRRHGNESNDGDNADADEDATENSDAVGHTEKPVCVR